MRHRKKVKKLGRTSAHRKAMLRNMATSLLKHERIKTTKAKGKEVVKVVEHLITVAKEGSLHARRQVAGMIKDRSVLKKLFDEIAPRYKERSGGYTRILKLFPRKGDAAQMVLVTFV